jgi:hypothetical protein
MPRTSTLKAAAAALGLLAGFVMAPQAQGPMDRDVTPYAIAVAWKVSAPPELPDVSGVQADDWGGRLAPAPRMRTAPPAPLRRRTPAAKPKPAPRPAPSVAKASPPAAAWDADPAVVRDAERAVALVPGACPREAVRVRAVRHVRARRHAHGEHEAREG